MKYLLNIDGISFYTTPQAIKKGVGQSDSVNNAARQVYQELLEYRRAQNGIIGKTIGCGGTGYFGHQAQINMVF